MLVLQNLNPLLPDFRPSIYMYIYTYLIYLFTYIYIYTYHTLTYIHMYICIPIQVSGIFPYIRPTFHEKHLPTPPLSRLQVILHEITDRTLGESIVPTARATSTLQVSIEVPCFAPTASHIDNAAAGWSRDGNGMGKQHDYNEKFYGGHMN